MKTIAVTIDEPTLKALDELARRAPRSRGQGRPSRSEIVRLALQDYLSRRRKAEREASDRALLARHRKRLAGQAEALVAEQAAP
jgi:metal-responsive CopG/Arc/MetJ family transcriptional regulator